MNRASDTTLHYDPRSIRLHWLTAVLVAALWGLGQSIDWFAKGEPRAAARSVHIVLGVVLACVVVARVWWRAHGAQRPPPGNGRLDALAAHVHTLLYVLLAVTAALGLANAWVRGDAVFHLLTLPAFDPGNKALRGQVEDLHALAANVLAGVAALHAAAGLAHHVVLKDSVLQRMLPSRARRGGPP